MINTMDQRFKALADVAAKAEPLGEQRGIPTSEEDQFLAEVYKDIELFIKKDKEADIRGFKERGMEYSNTCVLFTMFVLERYLNVKFDVRYAVRNFTTKGINFDAISNIVERTGLTLQSYMHEDGRFIDKDDLTKILKNASAKLHCGMIIMKVKENGEDLFHLAPFYPILGERKQAVRVIDCSGDISKRILTPEIDVLEIIEFFDPPAKIPKELRGGRKKGKTRRSKKTRGRK